MIKLTKNQKMEMDFLSSKLGDWWGNKFIPTEEEVIEFVNVTTYGKEPNSDSEFGGVNNRLLQGKRRLNLSIKMWEEDWGIYIFESELKEFNHPYIDKVINTINKNRIKKGLPTSLVKIQIIAWKSLLQKISEGTKIIKQKTSDKQNDETEGNKGNNRFE